MEWEPNRERKGLAPKGKDFDAWKRHVGHYFSLYCETDDDGNWRFSISPIRFSSSSGYKTREDAQEAAEKAFCSILTQALSLVRHI